MPPKVTVIETQGSRYRFDSMRHGDAINVRSKAGALETFRRWRKATGRQAKLVSSREFPNILYFVDEEIV